MVVESIFNSQLGQGIGESEFVQDYDDENFQKPKKSGAVTDGRSSVSVGRIGSARRTLPTRPETLPCDCSVPRNAREGVQVATALPNIRTQSC